METIKQLTWAACGCLAASSSQVCAGLSLQPIGCMPALSVMQNHCCSCNLWCYISDEPLPLTDQSFIKTITENKLHM